MPMPTRRIERASDASAKIGRQHFHADTRHAFAQQGNAAREMRRAAVTQIVAIDRGDDDVPQTQRGNRIGKMRGFVGIERRGPPVRDIAKWTTPRAKPAHDHESRRALREAFADIRAHRLLAHRMQPMLAQHGRHARHGLAHERPRAQPRRLRQHRSGACGRHDLHGNAREFLAAARAVLAERSRGRGVVHRWVRHDQAPASKNALSSRLTSCAASICTICPLPAITSVCTLLASPCA